MNLLIKLNYPKMLHDSLFKYNILKIASAHSKYNNKSSKTSVKKKKKTTNILNWMLISKHNFNIQTYSPIDWKE